MINLGGHYLMLQSSAGVSDVVMGPDGMSQVHGDFEVGDLGFRSHH